MSSRNGLLKVQDSIYNILVWSNDITKIHVENRGGPWNINSQLAHNHSEISEVYQAIRQGNSEDHIIEEMIDVIFAAFTNLCIYRMNKLNKNNIELDKDINYVFDLKNAVRRVMEKIAQRTADINYSSKVT